MPSVILVSLLLALFLLHVSGVLRPIESGARTILLPFARTFSHLSSSGTLFFARRESYKALEERVREFEARLASLAVDYVKLRSLEEENRSLRKLATFLESSGYDAFGARVIARSSDPRTATILIDRGASDGLENGMAVVMENGIFVGKIISLREHISTVMLIADRRSRVAVSIAGSQQLAGMVQGEGNGVARLLLVPQTEPLARNDVVVTASLEDKIPPLLPLAMVNRIDGKRTDPFKTASLQPLARVDRITLVAVLRPAALRPH